MNPAANRLAEFRFVKVRVGVRIPTSYALISLASRVDRDVGGVLNRVSVRCPGKTTWGKPDFECTETRRELLIAFVVLLGCFLVAEKEPTRRNRIIGYQKRSTMTLAESKRSRKPAHWLVHQMAVAQEYRAPGIPRGLAVFNRHSQKHQARRSA